MKKSISIIFLVFMSSCGFGQGLENIIVEKYYISDVHDSRAIGGRLPIGSVTYRIYVDMLPGYKFEAAFGLSGHELRIATTTAFFNNEDYGGTVANVIPYRNLQENSVMLDSWLSVGAASEGTFGVVKTEDDTTATIVNEKKFLQNVDFKAGIPIKERDGLVLGEPPLVTGFGLDSIIKIFGNHNEARNGQAFLITDGSWASMNGTVGPTPANRVLIAQMTTDGVFSFELNIQIGGPGGRVEQYVAKNPTGEQIQLASLTYPPINFKAKNSGKKTAYK